MHDDAPDEEGMPLADAAGGPLPMLRGFSRGRASIARPTAFWYVLASSDEVSASPLRRMLFGMPLVLFRDARGEPVALLDRCPHRNVPLSGGRVVEGQLECPYHGWRFDGGGRCRAIPSYDGETDVRARLATVFPTRELDGVVWVFGTADGEPDHEPYRFRLLDAPGYRVVRRSVRADATLHATLENALDVPHTQFLHRGLFRSESRGLAIEARVIRRGDRVEAEYLGEPRPTGLVGRILSPTGGVVSHVDRFLLPSIAEVEYRIGEENHVLVAAAMTPVEDFRTEIHAVVAYRTRLPAALLKPALLPLALRIFAQDAGILAQQTETIRRFGGERYASTEIDVLGRHIWRLLRAAERGEISRAPDVLQEQTVRLVV